MLEDAENEPDRRVIAREELVEALAASAAETAAVTETEAETVSTPAPVPGSVVPPRREGLPATLLAPDYQRILGVLDERQPAGHGPLKAREITVQQGFFRRPPDFSRRCLPEPHGVSSASLGPAWSPVRTPAL
ncbi:hypothetical protein ACWD5R_41465 [Streptomyces sp. NPDC002514]|uniref:hypothetical protein n=1 Tax=Streptomyces sp. NPDC001270 TaxID=3364554 RepID=UPI0036BF9A3C